VEVAQRRSSGVPACLPADAGSRAAWRGRSSPTRLLPPLPSLPRGAQTGACGPRRTSAAPQVGCTADHRHPAPLAASAEAERAQWLASRPALPTLHAPKPSARNLSPSTPLRPAGVAFPEGCSQRPSQCWVVESFELRTCVRDDRKCLQGEAGRAARATRGPLRARLYISRAMQARPSRTPACRGAAPGLHRRRWRARATILIPNVPHMWRVAGYGVYPNKQTCCLPGAGLSLARRKRTRPSVAQGRAACRRCGPSGAACRAAAARCPRARRGDEAAPTLGPRPSLAAAQARRSPRAATPT
jgi:hypothetical protein